MDLVQVIKTQTRKFIPKYIVKFWGLFGSVISKLENLRLRGAYRVLAVIIIRHRPRKAPHEVMMQT